MENTITISEKEYKSKMSAISMTSIGIGAILSGVILLTDKKIEKTTSYGIMGAGVLVAGIGFLFRQIDKNAK